MNKITHSLSMGKARSVIFAMTVVLGLGVAATVYTPLAGAQAISVLKGHDSQQPVDVDADHLEVLGRQDRAVFSGNVRVRQGDLAINASRMRVAYRNIPGQGLEVQRIDGDGGVQVRSPSEHARGDFAIYDLDKRLITLIGSVSLTRGDTLVKGQRLVMDLKTGRSTLDGGAVAGPSSGRVSGRFVVPKR